MWTTSEVLLCFMFTLEHKVFAQVLFKISKTLMGMCRWNIDFFKITFFSPIHMKIVKPENFHEYLYVCSVLQHVHTCPKTHTDHTHIHMVKYRIQVIGRGDIFMLEMLLEMSRTVTVALVAANLYLGIGTRNKLQIKLCHFSFRALIILQDYKHSRYMEWRGHLDSSVRDLIHWDIYTLATPIWYLYTRWQPGTFTIGLDEWIEHYYIHLLFMW